MVLYFPIIFLEKPKPSSWSTILIKDLQNFKVNHTVIFYNYKKKKLFQDYHMAVKTGIIKENRHNRINNN